MAEEKLDEVEQLLSGESEKLSGAFFESLTRNNKDIKKARAMSIAEQAKTTYKRVMEDLISDIKAKQREQEDMLDMSPESAISLKLAQNFEPADYVKDDIEIGLKIRNLKIKLAIVKDRYDYLFGDSDIPKKEGE